MLIECEDGEDAGTQIIAHVSVLITYYYPTELLSTAAADIAKQPGQIGIGCHCD
ncbi:hypothetical protein PC129_g17808 [Phytophthora cactorum]|uniref:Uncharacterized protein n=1 Tax=Phytophthora cactorum TaxID=29920 RepID=A0A329RZL9_9STRA|nr:hypothetical protein Pcac1_g10153 [Phytophthora cactorum]KAG2809276.1 hypothetical protein PC111_g16115 [Phytophthora cactorum]KAG2813168.1 hypothetical protein PC112_g14847 [Phytophthora cactorum]KAG2852377.1 hypothetical protein PC113_g15076 [Phytophthora cactorum]KAG2882689.1 hypothetical protein PC114_g20888 [Phytophthora cactorum]